VAASTRGCMVEFNAEHAKEFFDLFGSSLKTPKNIPRVVTPNTDPRVHPNRNPGASLVESLGATVDDLRQLRTDFGLRPYRVFSVVYEWDGGSPGRGAPHIISALEFLPTPVVIMNPRKVVTAAGSAFDGSAALSEVSARYTEDDIAALFPRLLGPAQQSYIEVRLDARDGANPNLRRYTVTSIPQLDAAKFEWTARLETQQNDRIRFTGELDPLKFYAGEVAP